MNIYSDDALNAHAAADEALSDIEQLIAAAELIAIDHFASNKREENALRGVIDAMVRRFADMDDLRATEWKALRERPKAETQAASGGEEAEKNPG